MLHVPPQPIQVLLISGSTRTRSSNTLALRKLHELDDNAVVTDLYTGMVELPAFVPGDDPLPPPVVDLLTRIGNADAVVFSTPEYAGSLPGSLKNLLDWTVGGGQLYEKPVAWLDVANPGRGEGARAQLGTVLGYVGAHIVEAACVHVALDSSRTELDVTPTEEAQLRAMQTALVVATQEDRDATAT